MSVVSTSISMHASKLYQLVKSKLKRKDGNTKTYKYTVQTDKGPKRKMAEITLTDVYSKERGKGKSVVIWDGTREIRITVDEKGKSGGVYGCLRGRGRGRDYRGGVYDAMREANRIFDDILEDSPESISDPFYYDVRSAISGK